MSHAKRGTKDNRENPAIISCRCPDKEALDRQELSRSFSKSLSRALHCDKHGRHLRTREQCNKDEPQTSVFYICRVFSNVLSVLSQCNKGLRFLHLLHDIEVIW